jgi:hypothetical protein
MKIVKGNILWNIAALCIAGVMLFVSSYVWAEDTIDVAYEITSNCDTLVCGDSIIVIHTVCAPICSSHARVYNKEWQEIGVLKAPFKSIFPEAYIENDKLLWRDNDTLSYSPLSLK